MGKRKYECSKEQISKKPKSNLQDCDYEEETVKSRNVSSNAVTEMQNVFDIKHFRKELATKQGQTIALTQFLQVCLNPDSGIDYMLEYLKSGGNSHEILRQIGQENKKNLTLATPAFHLFHLIILKVQSTLPHMIAINEEACRYFLNTFMPTIEIMISENSGPRHRKIVLKLLTSIVTFNPDLGIEVLNQAPLTPKHLQHIVEKINYKEKDNVRVAFVHFITSFLVDGHLPLIKALLEKQGLLQLVIPGLVQDEAEAVLMFLHILKKNVIDNSFLSKSLKLKTFSHQIIHNLFKLYNWKGPSDIKYEIKKEAHSEIMELVSDILLTLFTNHKTGLYFIDSSLGTSDTNKNQNLYKALLTLKRPWENENQCDVILQIVRKCPDLHRAIISIIEQSFEPQHSPIWEKAVSFVLKLLDVLKPEDMLPKLTPLSSTQIANFIRFTTLPVPLIKFLQENVCGKDMTIALYCIKILVKMLSSLKRYIDLLQINNLKYNELRIKLETFVPKHLPGSAPVVSLIQNVLCLIYDEKKKEYLINYFLTMLTLLTQALKECKSDNVIEGIVKNIYLAYAISKDFNQVDQEGKEDFSKLTENSAWHNFCKSTLRDCLKVKTVNDNFVCAPKLLCLMTTLVNFLYQSGHEDISQLFDMVTSHSEFLNVMLSHHSVDIKSRLVELLYVLIRKNSSVMKGQQIPVYLSAYHATRSPCDRMILKILHFYEIQGLAVHEYKPYVWGDSAANHYAVRKNRTTSLWSHPTPNQVLNLFDRSIIQNTIKYFPVTQKLDYDFELLTNIDTTGNGLLLDESIPILFDKMSKDGVFGCRQMRNNMDVVILKSKYDNVLNKMRSTELSLVSHAVEYAQGEEIYDPAFLLPLLSHLLIPGSIVSCFKLFRSGLLCVPVIALSSHCPLMRAAAYHVLHRFYLQLETEMKHKNDKLMLTDFINTLRQSLPSAITTEKTAADTLKEFSNPRVPSVDAMYLAKALSVATAPANPLYKPVNNFLIAKQFVDFTTIPDFLTLFHDSDVESADRRYWILDIIRDGTKTMSDVMVIFKTMCLKMIMDFYSSVMSDKKTKEKILDCLSSLVSIPRAAEILIQGYGFTPWMNSVIRNLKNDVTLIKSVLVVVPKARGSQRSPSHYPARESATPLDATYRNPRERAARPGFWRGQRRRRKKKR
ncbi:Nucleolar pre-ribosomal-associated protein 1 [Eumeta japonica]|uniref:Nucleolar pre-ribosomal-associated protein 1 n=1 Tax=Eumeta variegata TaxID=151549 RepID=A0A4C1TVE7_EUMVA|nr:Nucleolar pre-ribosomal-associated protein 1 [Eumeta japonica]